jgi:hypothetical protein
MNTRTLSTALIAVAVAIPAAAFAVQPSGRDTVYAPANASSIAAAPARTTRNEVQPNGRDSVMVSRVPGSGSARTGSAELLQRPGRG